MKIPNKYSESDILTIVKAGKKILTSQTRALFPENFVKGQSSLTGIALSLLATSYHHEGAGLAAPQINFDLSMFVMTIHPTSRYPDAPTIEDTVVVSPHILGASNEQVTLVEGCLSIPGFYAAVTRPKSIQATYYEFNCKTGKLKKVIKNLDGFAARVFQHEYDHTQGILFPARVQNWEYCASEENRGTLSDSVKFGYSTKYLL